LYQVGDLFELNVKLRCQKVNQTMVIATPLKAPQAAVAQNPIEATSSILCSKVKHKKILRSCSIQYISVLWCIFWIVRFVRLFRFGWTPVFMIRFHT